MDSAIDYNDESDNIYSFLDDETSQFYYEQANDYPNYETNELFEHLKVLNSDNYELLELTINDYIEQLQTLNSDIEFEPLFSQIPLNGTPAPRCGVTTRMLDLDADGTKETYLEVSLLNCHGNNFVSSVKSQFGGTCQTYAATAALEMTLAHKLHAYRPIKSTTSLLDFAPANLSEVMAYYNYGYTTIEVLSKNYGTNLEYYCPDVTASTQFNQRDADTLTARYAAIASSCQHLSNRSQQKQCILEASKTQSTLMYLPENHSRIASNYCIDTQNNSRSLCPTNNEYGKQNDRYQIDYWSSDMAALSTLVDGKPIKTSIKWLWDDNRTVRNIDSGQSHYDFKLVFPPDLASYQTAPTADNAKWKDSIINNQRHNFWANHAVVIVGYLMGTNGKHYYIIKNSHAERGLSLFSPWGNVYQERFVLVQTPGTSGDITQPNSTKRNLFIHSYTSKGNGFQGAGSNFTLIDDVTAADMNNNVYAPSNLSRNKNLLKTDRDNDGIIDIFDNCPTISNGGQDDLDLDGVGNACDFCPEHYERYQKHSYPFIPGNDIDQDGVPNYCDFSLNLQ